MKKNIRRELEQQSGFSLTLHYIWWGWAVRDRVLEAASLLRLGLAYSLHRPPIAMSRQVALIYAG